MNRNLLAFFFVLFLGSSLWGASPYEIADLETLYKENNFQEFLNHALDIRPSLRDSKWKKMVLEMAVDFIKDRNSRKQFDEKTFSYIETLINWPVLREDEIFFLKRNDFGVNFFKECFNSDKKEVCTSKINKFWSNTSIKNPDLGLSLAILLNENGYEGNLWEYLTYATNSNVAEFYCKNSLIKKEILKKIQSIISGNLSQFDQKVGIQNSMSESCLKTIVPEIKNAFLDIESSLAKELYLKFLNLTDNLGPGDRDFFLTLYFLQGPVVGDLFNESWNTIQVLGQNYNKRKAVLDKLKALNLLPDEIFANSNEKRRKIMLSHFYKNFPEYLDFYANTCVDFLEGKRSFPSGNPTLRCKDLFNEAEGTKIIEPSIQTKYQTIKKFEKKA